MSGGAPRQRAYLNTRYATDAGPAAWIGRRAPEVERLLAGRAGVFVTAWNPGSRRHPAGWNRRMEAALAERLRGLPHWPGWGEGRGWRERHALVAADPRIVMRLARIFRQAAVVVVSRRQARLVRLAGVPPS